MSLLRLFLDSKGDADVFTKLANELDLYSNDEINAFYIEISTLLKQCNKKINYKSILDENYRNVTENLAIDYQYGKFSFRINYSSQKVKLLIHPQISHLSNPSTPYVNMTFDIILECEELYLYRNKQICGSFNKKDYHLLQGKFAMELICLLTNTVEHDWLGTFHASTISNGKEAIMIIGDSGNGKSTLSALLIANGYHLVADDLTPMLAKTQHVYNYPAAVSIKQGAFEVLRPLIKDFNSYPSILLNKSKGSIKYIPFTQDSDHNNNFSCNKIIYIKYVEEQETQLSKMTIEDILPILITDSWISPDSNNVAHFLDWLETINCYKLQYGNSNEVIEVFDQLFES